MSAGVLEGCRTIDGLAAAGARKFGGRAALEQRDRELSYEDLNRRADGFAAWLAAHGVVRGDRVLLVIENSFEYVIALIGALRLGAVVVPQNPDAGAKFIRRAAEDCRCRAIVIRERVAGQLGDEPIAPVKAVMAPDFDKNCDAYFNTHGDVVSAADPGDPALILYTSGTTGQPKGVVLSHRALLANTASIIEYLSLTDADSILNVLPFFYSFGNSVLLTHLAVGGRMIIENRFLFPATIVKELARKRPTGFAGVPSTYYILMEKTPFLKQDLTFLRYVCQAGGGMRVEAIRRLRAALPSTQIFIMYGQTEAAARLSYLEPQMLERKFGSIGRGIPGVELKVVDDAGNALPPGEVGQVIARGDNLMIGYLNDSAATAEVLRDGWLWTGDMARVDDDGYIFIVSRKKDFIKSASYRISPGEIEEVVAEMGGIEDCAAIGVEDALLGEAIALCVACPADRFDAEAIRNHCLDRLPLYKVPKYVVHEPAIPHTPSGKKQYTLLREKYSRNPVFP